MHVIFQSTSTSRQFQRHEILNLVLVITHYHIISFRCPFNSSQAGSRFLLQSVKPEMIPCFTALVRGAFDAELTLT